MGAMSVNVKLPSTEEKAASHQHDLLEDVIPSGEDVTKPLHLLL